MGTHRLDDDLLPDIPLMPLRIIGALALLISVELIFLWTNGVALADFNFSCGVAGLTTSCGSIAP